jgi:hypothetical protein
MSTERDPERRESPDFDATVTDAADCLVEAHGLEGAIAELQERRSAGEENGRVNEALSYLRYAYRGGTDL